MRSAVQAYRRTGTEFVAMVGWTERVRGQRGPGLNAAADVSTRSPQRDGLGIKS